MRNPSLSSLNIDLQVCTTYRPWRGLKLALQDPKVYIFSLGNFSEVIGLGFLNFFPTSVMATSFFLSFFYAVYSLTATLGFSTTITLLMASYVAELEVRYVF